MPAAVDCMWKTKLKDRQLLQVGVVENNGEVLKTTKVDTGDATLIVRRWRPFCVAKGDEQSSEGRLQIP